MRAARDLLLVCLVLAIPLVGRGPPKAALGALLEGAPCEVFVEGEGGVRCLQRAEAERAPVGGTMAPARMAALGVPVDLNRATVEELASLDGVGRKLAERIIGRRPYRTVDEVVRVRGIGPKKLARMRGRLVVTLDEP